MSNRLRRRRTSFAMPPKEHFAAEFVPQSFESEDGVQTSKVVRRVRNILDPDSERVIPPYESFSLKAQLAAGVPMKEIPTSGLLNPTDPADLDSYGSSAAGHALSELEAEQRRRAEALAAEKEKQVQKTDTKTE